MKKINQWLITGGCGFIGTSLVRRLLKEHPDTQIRVLDNLSVGTERDLLRACGTESFPKGVELIVGDIKDWETCLKSCKNIDVIVHLAANTGVGPSVENPRLDMEANVIGTFNMLEAARNSGIGRFVFASSGAPAGECNPPIHEEIPPKPVSPYGAGKLAGEGYCGAFFRTFGLETVCLRFGNVYGHGSTHKSSVVAKFILRAMNGETLEIYGDGSQTRDFIHIDDLIRAILLSAKTPGIGGEIFQIAGGSETTILELIDILLPALAASGFADVVVNNTEPRTGDVRRNFSDTSKARKMLGWKAEVGLDDGLKQTVEWFLDRVEP